MRKPRVIEHPRASSSLFTNREIGWLNFDLRVLHEAQDPRTPLLERAKFLAISESNLDEFFMKRVGGLKRQVAAGITAKSSDGKTPTEQLVAIREFVEKFMDKQLHAFKEIKRNLALHKIDLLHWKDLSEDEKQKMKDYYKKNIFPVLTPLSVDPGHPFPFISNLSVSLGVTLKHPDSEEVLFARIKVPKNKEGLSPWLNTSSDSERFRFVSLIEVIKENLGDLFPAMQVLAVMAFRVTRNADLDHDEDDVEDLLKTITQELRQRRFAEVVRLEHGPHPDPWMINFLKQELELAPEDIFEHPGELDYSDMGIVADLELPHLKFPSFEPILPLAFQDERQSVFEIIKNADQLIHSPFESFNGTVERFIREAALDPQVQAIKMTLYRTGDQSPFVRALIRAADAGKQVVCLVELKARFDEERNIYWAQALEKAGVHVVYGIVGLKTHAKTALVVRQEPSGLQCYAHIGTGNYNVMTSKSYTDMGLLTARPEITGEVLEFFNFLTGRSLKKDYQHLIVAPLNMSQKLKLLIAREAEHAHAGRPGMIIAKFNNMEENDIALQLYEASKKKVQIDLIVRGFCCVRPGVPGLSNHMRVISIIGRFLEHSRLFYFRNGMTDPLEGDFYIGSADWMYRNLHARVEAMVPILDRGLKEKCWEVLQLCLTDERQAWIMNQDGNYTQKTSFEKGVHEKLIDLYQVRNQPLEEIEEKQENLKVYGPSHRKTRRGRGQGRVRQSPSKSVSRRTSLRSSASTHNEGTKKASQHRRKNT